MQWRATCEIDESSVSNLVGKTRILGIVTTQHHASTDRCPEAGISLGGSGDREVGPLIGGCSRENKDPCPPEGNEFAVDRIVTEPFTPADQRKCSVHSVLTHLDPFRMDVSRLLLVAAGTLNETHLCDLYALKGEFHHCSLF